MSLCSASSRCRRQVSSIDFEPRRRPQAFRCRPGQFAEVWSRVVEAVLASAPRWTPSRPPVLAIANGDSARVIQRVAETEMRPRCALMRDHVDAVARSPARLRNRSASDPRVVTVRSLRARDCRARPGCPRRAPRWYARTGPRNEPLPPDRRRARGRGQIWEFLVRNQSSTSRATTVTALHPEAPQQLPAPRRPVHRHTTCPLPFHACSPRSQARSVPSQSSSDTSNIFGLRF